MTSRPLILVDNRKERENIRNTKKKNTSHNPIISEKKIDVVYLLDGCRLCIRPFTHIPEGIEYCHNYPTGSMRARLGWQANQPARHLPE